MVYDEARRITEPSPMRVELSTRTFDVTDVFDTFVALRARFGERDTYLLESLAGPAGERTRARIGVGPLLTVAVRRDAVSVGGYPPVARRVRDRLDGTRLLRPAEGDVPVVRDQARLEDLLREVHRCFTVDGLTGTEFGFGLLALLGRDASRLADSPARTIPGADTAPDVLLRLYASALDIDPRTGRCTLTASRSQLWEPPDEALLVRTALAGPGSGQPTQIRPPEGRQPSGHPVPGHPVPGHPVPGYLVPGPAAPGHGARRAARRSRSGRPATPAELDVIARAPGSRFGDLDPVWLGHLPPTPRPHDDIEAYQRMRAGDPPPFLGFIPLPDLTILSADPRLRVLLRGRVATVRPIGGGPRRGHGGHADPEAVAWPHVDEKKRAEPVMLVDLCRDGLARMAAGSGTVSARVADGLDIYDIVGSLEDDRRGGYAGVFGVIGFGGFADLALCGRTIVRHPGSSVPAFADALMRPYPVA